MKLVIVESPTKAKTIARFLGSDYTIESSYGHIRDLPKSKLGIDVDHDFEPQYIIPRKASPRVTALKKLAKKSDAVILATDEDREGEAIAWHLAQALNLGDPEKAKRIVFHEITESAIKHALTTPRTIQMDLVNAQQARRVLDRLVGYKLSPFLWKKISRGLSAGRVQSVALRLIADREAEITRFVPQEYWSIDARLTTGHGELEAQLAKRNGEALDRLAVTNETEAKQIAHDLERATHQVTTLESKEVRKHPAAPFTTSTLQQTAAKRLGISSKKTMFLAQQLYENGHITYMRTDSVNLSQEALTAAAAWISANLPGDYALPAPRTFKNTSRLAQEAHEAIRPTNAHITPDTLAVSKDEQRLYDLIWRRFIASQLPPAVLNAVHVEVTATTPEGPTYGLTANGSTMKFDGFLKIWPVKFESKELPQLTENEMLTVATITPNQHFTEPPPRYNEASLIKTLEAYGIGRPSTYAPTIAVILARNYVERQQGRFFPTEMGMLVNKVITENFPDIVDVDFTAKMENQLDDVAEGKESWQKLIRDFYTPFAAHLAVKYEEVKKDDIVPPEVTDQICEKCGKPMVVKFGRFGKFLACSGFPDCKNAKPLKDPPKSSGVKCAKCLANPDRKDNPGELLERRVRAGRARGKVFWGCSRYPDCDFAVWLDPIQTPPVWSQADDDEKAAKKAARKKYVKGGAKKGKKKEEGTPPGDEKATEERSGDEKEF